MNHCMVDLETLDTAPTSAIISIGAVIFDSSEVLARHYSNIYIDDFLLDNFTISASTLRWWMGQPEAMGFLLKDADQLEAALKKFGNFLLKNSIESFWGNGTMFDNAILTNAYKVCELNQPWSYRADRCYRTLRSSFKSLDLPFDSGVKHNALHDAEYQANYLIALNKANNLNIL